MWFPLEEPHQQKARSTPGTQQRAGQTHFLLVNLLVGLLDFEKVLINQRLTFKTWRIIPPPYWIDQPPGAPKPPQSKKAHGAHQRQRIPEKAPLCPICPIPGTGLKDVCPCPLHWKADVRMFDPCLSYPQGKLKKVASGY
jgi:hypothetical protein